MSADEGMSAVYTAPRVLRGKKFCDRIPCHYGRPRAADYLSKRCPRAACVMNVTFPSNRLDSDLRIRRKLPNTLVGRLNSGISLAAGTGAFYVVPSLARK